MGRTRGLGQDVWSRYYGSRPCCAFLAAGRCWLPKAPPRALTRVRRGRSGRLLSIEVGQRASGGLTTAAAVKQTFSGWIRPAACAPYGYGERIEPLQASFARANESVTQASDIPHSLMQRIDPM